MSRFSGQRVTRKQTTATNPYPFSPRDTFLHAKPWQFGRAGRKFRIVAERMRRLCRVLARVDRSGECRSIFPSVETILARLRSTELNYPAQGPPWLRRMAWSRRTVFVYLERLERAGIATAVGLGSYHGTRRRSLHPEKLLFVPRESCTPTLHESCTRSKSLDSKKLQGSRKKKNHPPNDTASSSISRATPPESNVVIPLVERTSKAGSYAERLAKFTAVARRNILVRTSESVEVVDAILKTVLGRAADARTEIRSPSYLERAFDSQLADEAAQLERYGGDAAPFLASASEIRRKIVFVHACVEQAAREGRRAREVLAERLPP